MGGKSESNQREGLTLPPGQKLLEGTVQEARGQQCKLLSCRFFLGKIINKGSGGGRGGSAPVPAHLQCGDASTSSVRLARQTAGAGHALQRLISQPQSVPSRKLKTFSDKQSTKLFSSNKAV